MKDYKTLTREKVDADPGAARYMGETHLLEDWSDKLLDLVLNGPTLNGFKKDEIRAALRQTYTALKQYEQIGPMASPYMNDPSAIVARAFAELYPGIDYHAQTVRLSSASRPRRPSAPPLNCWPTSWPMSPRQRTETTARHGRQLRRPSATSTTRSSTP